MNGGTIIYAKKEKGPVALHLIDKVSEKLNRISDIDAKVSSADIEVWHCCLMHLNSTTLLKDLGEGVF